jgi:hypothetical protein
LDTYWTGFPGVAGAIKGVHLGLGVTGIANAWGVPSKQPCPCDESLELIKNCDIRLHVVIIRTLLVFPDDLVDEEISLAAESVNDCPE